MLMLPGQTLNPDAKNHLGVRMQCTSDAASLEILGSCHRRTLNLQERLQRDMEAVLFTANSSSAFLREGPPSFRRRCGVLEPTMQDILKEQHRISVASLDCCPEASPSTIRPAKRRRIPCSFLILLCVGALCQLSVSPNTEEGGGGG